MIFSACAGISSPGMRSNTLMWAGIIREGLQRYVGEVKKGVFPGEEQSRRMAPEELALFREALGKRGGNEEGLLCCGGGQEIPEMGRIVAKWRQSGGKVGFVPTMGYFHRGHLALMERARAENDYVVVSLFVNPTQFGPGEDFARYPRDLERDRRLAGGAGADALFHPAPEEMYPGDYQTYVEVTGLSQGVVRHQPPRAFPGCGDGRHQTL